MENILVLKQVLGGCVDGLSRIKMQLRFRVIITSGSLDSIGHITGGTNNAILFDRDNKCDLLSAGIEWKVAA